MKKLITAHPLLTILILAVFLRLIAVIFSQGYMASDDHHETIEVAWKWHVEGKILNDDGVLTWSHVAGQDIKRSPVYNLFLLLIFKLGSFLGLSSLNQHMYLQRIIHALASLLPVIYTYKYLLYQCDRKTALYGGLAAAVFFIMPFLAVRNLIEMVAADLLVPGLFYAQRGINEKENRDLVIAGILGGLAWVIRPHVIMAVLPVIAILLIKRASLKALIAFTLPLLVVFTLAGLLDLYMIGGFLWSQYQYFAINTTVVPWAAQPFYFYIPTILLYFLPPFSLIFLGAIFQKRIIRNHGVMFWGFLVFLISHSIFSSKYARFLMPVFPLILILGMVGLYYMFQGAGWYFKRSWLRKSLWTYAILINFILLIPTTLNYSHKGRIEPLVFLSQQNDIEGIIYYCIERKVLIPFQYLGDEQVDYAMVRTYAELESLKPDDFNYAVIFTDNRLDEHIDSLKTLYQRIKPVMHSSPSIVDYILQRLNPRHNHSNQSWVVKLE
jgi:hypothetical protein